MASASTLTGAPAMSTVKIPFRTPASSGSPQVNDCLMRMPLPKNFEIDSGAGRVRSRWVTSSAMLTVCSIALACLATSSMNASLRNSAATWSGLPLNSCL